MVKTYPVKVNYNWDKNFNYYTHLSLYSDASHYITWADASTYYDWCSGSGSWNDPYIIENVYINAGSIGSCLSLWNSNSCFIIRNSHFHDSGSQEHDSGTRLISASNGSIINNFYSYNHETISLLLSQNILISDNDILCDDVTSGYGRGILLRDSSENIISDNILTNHYDGIILWDSHYNIITKNFINTTIFGHYPDTGVYLKDSNYNEVTFNTFAGDYANYVNPFGGSVINQDNCTGNSIGENFNSTSTISSSQLKTSVTWFFLENSNYNYIYGNTFFEEQEHPSNPNPAIHSYHIFILIGMIMVISTMVIGKNIKNLRFK